MIRETLDTTSSALSGPDAFGSVYGNYSVSLAAFKRASAIAANYQFYRINRLVWKFKPMSELFYDAAGTGQSGSVPYLHYIIDRNESVPVQNLSFDAMRSMGAKPIRFDDKTITVSYKPGVSYSVNDDGGQTAWQAFKVSPWLDTNGKAGDPASPWTPSSIDHKGIVYGVEQYNTISASQNSRFLVELEVYFEFKRPLAQGEAPADGKVTPIVHKNLDRSSLPLAAAT